MNRIDAVVELFAGRPVDREDLLPYLDLTVEADGVDGSMRLEGAETAICPERTLAALGSPSRRPPCRNPECLLTLRPGESIELLWSGWLLRPNDARAEPRDEVHCFHRRAPLPLEHHLVLCGHQQDLPGGPVCARARTALPTDGDIVLAFGSDASSAEGHDAN